MTPLALARRYMEVIFSGADVDALHPLLTDDFTFRGPLYRFDSAAQYIEAMASDPLKDASYRILREFGGEDAACLVYEFTKPGVTTVMAQLFEVRDGRVAAVLLLFDSAAFT